jgi:hypothetical protein
MDSVDVMAMAALNAQSFCLRVHPNARIDHLGPHTACGNECYESEADGNRQSRRRPNEQSNHKANGGGNERYRQENAGPMTQYDRAAALFAFHALSRKSTAWRDNRTWWFADPVAPTRRLNCRVTGRDRNSLRQNEKALRFLPEGFLAKNSRGDRI